jgi:hypothetical protein
MTSKEELFNTRKSIILGRLTKIKIVENSLKKIINDFTCPIEGVKLTLKEKEELRKELEPEILYFIRKQDDQVKLKRGVSLIDPDPEVHKPWVIDKST